MTYIEPGYPHVPDPNVGLRRMLRMATLLADALTEAAAQPANRDEAGWGEDYFAQFMGTPRVPQNPRPANPTNPTKKSNGRVIRVDM